VIGVDLAVRLRDAGLVWHPDEGDRFVLTDRDLDGRVFTISDMVVEVRRSPVGTLIAFNGTTEWALDAIEQAEAVWLPRETQLREALGEDLVALVRTEGGRWRVSHRLAGALQEVEELTAEDAYGRALLARLGGGDGSAPPT
jgi:hypothetical protein